MLQNVLIFFNSYIKRYENEELIMKIIIPDKLVSGSDRLKSLTNECIILHLINSVYMVEQRGLWFKFQELIIKKFSEIMKRN